ncbi:MAG: insulinase family protein [Cytophagales bacterium]|nr:insulinase family protein [Cytophagales bacterium]
MRSILNVLLLLAFSIPLLGQPLDNSKPIPSDPKVKKGVLPNGMTYYIYPTDVTKERASYYIIQNVGSILENDDQKGLAHFLEHMAFNGTKHFEGKGILNTLQKHGAIFGRDINAYTGFDETVYNLSDIPTTNELIDTCLLVLHDWSNYLLLTDEEIDAERGVIAEEKRTRESGYMRLLTKALPTVMNGAKYAERLPIGDMDIVANFKYKTLRDFYHDWYRTDLQAIAVIGDVDVQEIENKIKERFSHIPAVENPKKRCLVNIPDNEELLFHMGTDEEVSTSSMSFSIRHPKSFKKGTVADLRKSLFISMATGMINDRLKEIQQKPDAPFLYAGLYYGSRYARTSENLGIRISPKPDMQREAFQLVMNEINRALKFGFTKGEIDRKISSIKNRYENSIKKLDDRSHREIIQGIKSNYLLNGVIADVPAKFELVKTVLNEMKPEDLRQEILSLYTKKNRVFNLTGVEGKKNLTKKDVLEILQHAENNASLTAYEEKFESATLLGDLKIVPGKIVKEKAIKELGATTFELSNGAKVHYMFADKDKNDVRLQAVSYGGNSLLDDASLPSCSMLSNLTAMSGLGDYKANDLKKVMAGKTAGTSVYVGGLTEGISGNASTKDVESMLQSFHLRFVKPRFDEESYQVLQNNLSQYLIRKSKNVRAQMQDRLVEAIHGKNNPRASVFDQNYIDKISFDRIKSIYSERFKDVADFDIFIAGDCSKEKLKPLLEKYIASIPSGKNRETWKDRSPEWVKPVIKERIPIEMENPKGTVNIAFKKKTKNSVKGEYMINVLADILDLRYTESIREEEGGTYGVGVWGSLKKRPYGLATLNVRFDCNPERADDLIKIVYKEIEKIKNGDIRDEDLQKTLTSYLKDRKEAKDKNRFYMRWLQNYVREGYNLEDPKNFENIIKSITKKSLQKFARKVLEGSDSYQVVFVPKPVN